MLSDNNNNEEEEEEEEKKEEEEEEEEAPLTTKIRVMGREVIFELWKPLGKSFFLYNPSQIVSQFNRKLLRFYSRNTIRK